MSKWMMIEIKRGYGPMINADGAATAWSTAWSEPDNDPMTRPISIPPTTKNNLSGG